MTLSPVWHLSKVWRARGLVVVRISGQRMSSGVTGCRGLRFDRHQRHQNGRRVCRRDRLRWRRAETMKSLDKEKWFYLRTFWNETQHLNGFKPCYSSLPFNVDQQFTTILAEWLIKYEKWIALNWILEHKHLNFLSFGQMIMIVSHRDELDKIVTCIPF